LIRRVAVSVGAAGLLWAGVTVVAPSTAFAYNACQSTSSGSVSQSSGNGGQNIQFTGQFEDCNGNAVAGAQVQFAQQSGPCQATFSTTAGTSNSQGQATTTITLPPNCPGVYVFSGEVQGVRVQVTVRELGGFPNTGAAPLEAVSASFGFVPLALIAGGLALVAFGVISVAVKRHSGHRR
jgi:hypothetical protein